ncbi:MAG: hypothetical protein IT371_09125 [Deltaproteobacteria bacterium]|nr:hypothetical protein [Deltaproteobacteria bacterium]
MSARRGRAGFLTGAGVLCALLGLRAAAFAEESRMVREARAYARQHGFQVRAVQAGDAAQPVQRLFVPVTAQTQDDFLRRFTAPHGYACLRFDGGSHMVMALQPNDCYLWGRNYNGTEGRFNDCRHMYMRHNGAGYFFPLDLQGGRLQHLTGWLEGRNAPNDPLYRGGNCMEWLPNAEVRPGQPLFYELGLKRSRDGRNMKAKLLHAANHEVQVVGYCTNDANAFIGAGVQTLLGPPPAGGIPDARR